jgi:hypothetical protein
MSALTDTLRAMVKVRGKSVPLSDLIRICQQAADRIDELEAKVESLSHPFDRSGDAPPPIG